MKKKSITPRHGWLILVFVLSGWSFSFGQQEDQELPSIDMSTFASSVRHWYVFFSDGRLIQPLPDKPRYELTQIEEIADNILLFQRKNGGWPKNFDMRAILTDEQKEKLQAAKSKLNTTYDNGTTYPQIAYLAQAYTITGLDRFKEGALKGIDFILESQYDNGGWPQYYPLLEMNAAYSKRITLNDDAYVGVMHLLKDVVDEDPNYAFIKGKLRNRITAAYEKGLDCLLRMQIEEGEQLKVWCQQHDQVTLEPVWARTFEPPCEANEESASVVLFLMRIDQPGERVVRSIQGAVKWFNSSQLLYTRYIKDPTAPKYVSKYRVHNYDCRIVYDLDAPPIWPRYSELETGVPIFCDRSGEILYRMSDLGRERRSGYGWYTYLPQEVLDQYPAWQQKWAPKENVLMKQ